MFLRSQSDCHCFSDNLIIFYSSAHFSHKNRATTPLLSRMKPSTSACSKVDHQQNGKQIRAADSLVMYATSVLPTPMEADEGSFIHDSLPKFNVDASAQPSVLNTDMNDALDVVAPGNAESDTEGDAESDTDMTDGFSVAPTVPSPPSSLCIGCGNRPQSGLLFTDVTELYDEGVDAWSSRHYARDNRTYRAHLYEKMPRHCCHQCCISTLWETRDGGRRRHAWYCRQYGAGQT